jgi:hypothetical protein
VSVTAAAAAVLVEVGVAKGVPSAANGGGTGCTDADDTVANDDDGGDDDDDDDEDDFDDDGNVDDAVTGLDDCNAGVDAIASDDNVAGREWPVDGDENDDDDDDDDVKVEEGDSVVADDDNDDVDSGDAALPDSEPRGDGGR